MTDSPPSQSFQRDLWLSFLVAIIIGAPILYFDIRLYGAKVVEHLPDHLLALIAIIAGVIAVRYERKLDRGFELQKRELNASFDAQKNRIEAIVLAIYTRFLGEWPGHLKDITHLVAGASRGDELLISIDLFGYGHFTAPEEYKKYFRAIEHARRAGVKIKIMVHPEHSAMECLRSQLDEYKNNFEPLRQRLAAYQAHYPQLIQSLPTTYQGFLRLALYVQSSLCRQLGEAVIDEPVEIKTTVNPSPVETVFLWMIRHGGKGREMVFAYPRYLGVGTGYGFKTQDSHLMEIFSGQFDEKWKKASNIDRGADLYPKAVDDVRSGRMDSLSQEAGA